MSSVSNMEVSALFRGGDDAPIYFLDLEDKILTSAQSKCQYWGDTGATTEVSTDRTWQRNNTDTNGVTAARPTYPEPQRQAADNPGTRDMHDAAEKKRTAFMAARQELKAELVAYIGPNIIDAMASEHPRGSIMFMSCQDIMQYMEDNYGTLENRHIKKIVASLQDRLERVDDFLHHAACFQRPVRRLQRAQSRMANGYTIVPTSQQLFDFLLASISHLPHFAPTLTPFGTKYPSLSDQTYTNLTRHIRENMSFIKTFSSSEGFAGLFANMSLSQASPPNPAPIAPPSSPTPSPSVPNPNSKSARRRASQRA